MVKIAICDDEIKIAHEIESAIRQMPFNNIETEVFLSGSELIEHYTSTDRFHIVLLDIEMPSANGIETAMRIRKLDSNFILVFVTAYREYVYQVFESLPFRFLEKPLSYEKLFAVIKDALYYIEDTKSYFFFKKGATVHQLSTKEILYFEAANRKVKIYTANSEEVYYGRFKNVIGQLNPNYFLQIHTSYIVNMEYISSFSDKAVILRNHILLPVSLKYKENAHLGHLKFIERRCGEW